MKPKSKIEMIDRLIKELSWTNNLLGGKDKQFLGYIKKYKEIRKCLLKKPANLLKI